MNTWDGRNRCSIEQEPWEGEEGAPKPRKLKNKKTPEKPEEVSAAVEVKDIDISIGMWVSVQPDPTDADDTMIGVVMGRKECSEKEFNAQKLKQKRRGMAKAIIWFEDSDEMILPKKAKKRIAAIIPEKSIDNQAAIADKMKPTVPGVGEEAANEDPAKSTPPSIDTIKPLSTATAADFTVATPPAAADTKATPPAAKIKNEGGANEGVMKLNKQETAGVAAAAPSLEAVLGIQRAPLPPAPVIFGSTARNTGSPRPMGVKPAGMNGTLKEKPVIEETGAAAATDQLPKSVPDNLSVAAVSSQADATQGDHNATAGVVATTLAPAPPASPAPALLPTANGVPATEKRDTSANKDGTPYPLLHRAPLTPATKDVKVKDVTHEVHGLLTKRVLSPMYATDGSRGGSRGGSLERVRVKNMDQLIKTACLEIYGELNDTNARSISHVLTDKFMFLDSTAAPPPAPQASKRIQRELATSSSLANVADGRRPSRTRKKTELFDASTSSADYSRKLRKECEVRRPFTKFRFCVFV
jgi:hypothetical protein